MSIFDDYLRRDGAKPMWQIAFEAGCGSVDYLHQIARGRRTANPAQAVGIEIATGGVVKRQQLRPHDADVVWGSAQAVHERMELVRSSRKDVYAEFVGAGRKERGGVL